jgi:hypothetical protein
MLLYHYTDAKGLHGILETEQLWASSYQFLNDATELLVALPQNRQYDYIQVNDKIEIGWDKQSGICFPKK